MPLTRVPVALCLLLASCAPKAEPGLRTMEDAYEAVRTVDAVAVTIPYTYTNATGATVYINRCQEPDPPSLQKQQEDLWQTVYAPPRLLCLGPPVVIDAGEVHEGQLEVRAALDPDTHPRWEAEQVPGTYRLVLDVFGDVEPGGNGTNLLDVEQRVSAPFEITERYVRDPDGS